MKKTLLIFMLLSIAVLNAPAEAPVAQKHVLILYDLGPDPRQPAMADARYLANLMGHFDASVNLMPVNNYKSGEMGLSDIVFYINYEKVFPLNDSFKSDLYKYRKTFCWFNHQLGQLDQTFLKNNFGFHYLRFSENQGYDKIIYKNTVFPKGDDNLSIVSIDDPKTASVVCYAFDKKSDKAPYIVRSRNFWFVADSPFSYCSEQDRYIAFCDILHDIVGENHPESHTALVRIEDVNATTDPKSLLRIAKYLNSKRIPFAISLVPLYVDPGNKVEIRLEDKPALLSVLKKMPSLGGCFVMHGYTHQYHGVTTDDYEFWDDVADKPVRGDSVENASLRIEKGLKELFSNDIYPIAWETPHYFASKNTYNAIKKYFSITYDRRGTMDFLGSDQFFPYPVKDIYGQKVIPEDLGYVHVDEPDTKGLLDAARLELEVRDGYASFFFHPFVDIKYLRQIIDGLDGMGYTFGDARSFFPKVTAKDKAVLTVSGKIKIESKEKYVLVTKFDHLGRELEEKNIPSPAPAAMSLDIKCPPGGYTVVKTEDELEPGFFVKVWRLAKADVSYFRGKREKKGPADLVSISDVVFINPIPGNAGRDEEKDAQSLKFSLTAAGVKFSEISQKDITRLDLRDYDIIILPYAAAKSLKEEDIRLIKEAVSSGSNIVFDGPTKLMEALDIELQQEPVNVKQIRDFQYPEIPLYWPVPTPVKPIYGASEKDYKTFCVEEESNLPIVVGGRFGKGGFIFFSSLFDPESGRGYSRYPFLIEMLGNMFDYNPLADRKSVEMYFDPGLRQFISTEKLVMLWKKYGINRIYAGGWHFYDKYSYDYARLIRVCHQNGILVYCWLEPPMVNQKFWNKYPEWREKTALLRDAKVGWRFLMNFADPVCREKVFSETESLLMKYDWDGVNLAEFYFDSPAGPSRPENFTPMNNIVRADFKKQSGFDPLELFRPEDPHYWTNDTGGWKKFAQYRRDLCNRLKKEYIVMLGRIKKKKGDFEIMMTSIDDVMEPQLYDNIAEDSNELISMGKKYGLTLQIEDPSIFWKGRPERYLAIGKYYKKLVTEKGRLVLDCNVLENRRKGDGGLPADKPTGEEIRQIAYNMDLTNSRLAFYSEESIYENDFKNITSVLARDVKIAPIGDMQWRITTPFMVTIRTGKKDLITKLNEEPWFASEAGNIIIPAGEHTLKFENEPRYFDISSLRPRLQYLSSELKWANFLSNGIEFSYEGDDAPTYAVISKRPGKIFVDAKRSYCQVLEGDNGFSVRLPSGNHVVKIVIGGSISRLIETSGVVLFSIVFIFGICTSVLFLGLFAAIQIKRKLSKNDN